MDEDFLDLVFCFSTVLKRSLYYCTDSFIIFLFVWEWMDGRTGGRCTCLELVDLSILYHLYYFLYKEVQNFYTTQYLCKRFDANVLDLWESGFTTSCSLHYTFTTFLRSLTTNKTGIWSKSIKIS